MDDLISRQDALKALDEMSYKSPHESAISVVRKKHFGEILEKFIMQQPSAQQWIPCSERLPKAEEKVWIQTQSGKACFAMYEDGTIPECDSNWSWFDIEYSSWDEDKDSGIIPEGWWEFTVFHPDCEFDCPVDEKVVAWMPLPERYKEENDG